MLIASEAGELVAEYRWVRGDEADAHSRAAEPRARIAGEIADVGLGLLLLCDRIGLDLVDAMSAKLARNAERYPVDASKGKAERLLMAAAKLASPVLVLATPAAWRAWLRVNHARSAGVFLRIPKAVKGSARAASRLRGHGASRRRSPGAGSTDKKRALDAEAWLQPGSRRAGPGVPGRRSIAPRPRRSSPRERWRRRASPEVEARQTRRPVGPRLRRPARRDGCRPISRARSPARPALARLLRRARRREPLRHPLPRRDPPSAPRRGPAASRPSSPCAPAARPCTRRAASASRRPSRAPSRRPS